MSCDGWDVIETKPFFTAVPFEFFVRIKGVLNYNWHCFCIKSGSRVCIILLLLYFWRKIAHSVSCWCLCLLWQAGSVFIHTGSFNNIKVALKENLINGRNQLNSKEIQEMNWLNIFLIKYVEYFFKGIWSNFLPLLLLIFCIFERKSCK